MFRLNDAVVRWRAEAATAADEGGGEAEGKEAQGWEKDVRGYVMRDLYCKTPMDLEIVEEIEKSRREARGVTAVAADGGGTGSAIYLQDSNGNITSSSTQITTTPPPAPIDALKISDRSEEWWSSVTPFALKTEVIRRRDENFKRTRELVTADGSDGWNLWTYEENVKLVSMVETYGHAWSIIKGEFPGRR